jgi:hypothetical protein
VFHGALFSHDDPVSAHMIFVAVTSHFRGRVIGQPSFECKLPNLNHWNASCFDIGSIRTGTRTQAMEAVKIYLLMALIGTIAAASWRKAPSSAPEKQA